MVRQLPFYKCRWIRLLTLVPIQVSEASRLASNGETASIVRTFEGSGACVESHERLRNIISAKSEQFGPRSTAHSATGHPLLLVILMGKLYPSTRETGEITSG